jgi:hypothetical protein
LPQNIGLSFFQVTKVTIEKTNDPIRACLAGLDNRFKQIGWKNFRNLLPSTLLQPDFGERRKLSNQSRRKRENCPRDESEMTSKNESGKMKTQIGKGDGITRFTTRQPPALLWIFSPQNMEKASLLSGNTL